MPANEIFGKSNTGSVVADGVVSLWMTDEVLDFAAAQKGHSIF